MCVQGNAEQSLSRDIARICDRLDFFRLMSFYYGGIGHYMVRTIRIAHLLHWPISVFNHVFFCYSLLLD